VTDRVPGGLAESHRRPPYRDVLIVLAQSGEGYHASIWRRHWPNGRQRRIGVASYTLDVEAPDPSPEDLLRALIGALKRPPDYTV